MAARVTGVRHIKIWVSSLERSRAWYEQVFGLELALTFEDEDGVVRDMGFRGPDGMQIRLYAGDPGVAAQAGNRVVPRSTPTEWQRPRSP
jgi:catechol 2,3-dioxygenase-like lactoylglutathione lyase family enzyme